MENPGRAMLGLMRPRTMATRIDGTTMKAIAQASAN